MALPPITAIVIFRNERDLLDGCLSSLRWCDELICVDMASQDGSAEVARRYADRLFRTSPHPIAEPTRVAAAQLARNDWVLLVDPDEHLPAALLTDLEATLAATPDAGAVRLPWWYYFKRKRLRGTIWGNDRSSKRMLIHRRRCRLLPYCNRISELMPGYHDAVIPGNEVNHVRHYWCDSYRKLIHRHLTRYCHTEAAAMAAQGQRFSLRHAILHPLSELRRCLRDYDGWRLGPRGWTLSLIYFGYVLLSDWLLLRYQRRSAAAAIHVEPAIPMLRELELPRRSLAA